MGLRLQTDFYSDEGNKYSVFIYDSGWGGLDTGFTAVSMALNYATGKERTPAFLGSEFRVGILVENATINTFVNNLMDASDGVFEIKVNKNDSLHWVGIVKTDGVTQQDRPYPYVFNLSATDGIARLKGIDYNNAGVRYTGQATYLEHVFNILGKLGLDGYWSGGEDYVVTVNDWREENLTYAVGTDPWEVTRTIHHHLYEVVDLANNLKKWTSCYDLLMSILTQWGMRLLLSDGAYHFVQVNSYAETGTVVIRKFDKAQVISTTSSTSLAVWDAAVGEAPDYKSGTADLFKVTSGGFQAWPALNKVRVAYNHNSISNWISGSVITTLTSIDDINSNSGQASVALQGTIKIDSFSGTATFIYVRFKILFKIGTQYLSRTQSVNYVTGNLITSDISWTTDTAARYELIIVVPNTNVLFENVGFVTPVFPADGDAQVQIDYVEARDINGTLIPDGTLMLSWYFENGYLEILATNDLDDQNNTTYYQADNDTAGNYSFIDLKTIWGGDTHPTSSGQQKVTNDGGSTWNISEGWRYGASGIYITMQQLLADEILRGQMTPVRKMVSQIYRGDYSAHFTLVRNSENWIFNGGTHNMKLDQWSGTWFYVSTETSGFSPITAVNIKEIQTDNVEIYLSAPSNQTPGLAILDINKDIDISDVGGDGNAAITSIQTPMVKQTGYEEVFIPIMHPGDLFLDGDSVVVKNQGNGELQSFVVSKIGHNSGGDSVLTEYKQESNYDFPAGALVIPSPLEQQYNINFGRRKFMNFQLVDFGTDFTTSASYVTLGPFFRPFGHGGSSESTIFVDRLAIRNVYFMGGAFPSASGSIHYTVQMVRGSTPDVVATVSMYGITGELEVAPNTGEEFFHDDVYWFRYKKNDASGLSENKGLYVMVEFFNKKYYPGDFSIKFYWWRLEDDYLNDGSDQLQTWSSGGTAMDFDSFFSAVRPELIWNSLNGYPGAKFERSGGTPDYLETAGAGPDTSTIDFTLFMLIDSGDLSALKGHGLFCQADGAGTGRELLWINTSLEIESTFGNINLTGPVLDDNTVYLITLSWDGTNQYMYINGDYDGSNTPTPEGVPGVYYLGKSKASSNTPYFDGIMYEVLFFEEWLPDTKRELVEGYLSNKFTHPLG